MQKGVHQEKFNIHQKILVLIFDFRLFSIGEGYHKHNILIIHQIISHISIFVNFSHIILLTIFCAGIVLIGTMEKDICRSFKYNRPKSSSPTLKKPIVSSLAHHTSCITISNPPVTSYPRQRQGSASNQDKVNISNTDDIHSCVTPESMQ